MIFVPLLDKEPRHRQAHRLSRPVARPGGQDPREVRARQRRRGRGKAPPKSACTSIGFAKLIGELIDGLVKVMLFFGVAARSPPRSSIAYTRCVRSTALVIACSLVAVVWQLGLVALLGFELDPVLDPRAVPRVRHRRVARRAEDERHHAGHRPRHAQARRRALHVPPPVPRRPHRAARRRRRLRGADGDRHPGHPRARDHREHRRRRAHLHQPAAAAGAPVVRRRERNGGASAASPKSARKRAAEGSASCGFSSTASRRGRYATAPIVVVGRARRRRLRGEHEARRSATSIRARPSFAPTRATTATPRTSRATTRCHRTSSRSS